MTADSGEQCRYWLQRLQLSVDEERQAGESFWHQIRADFAEGMSWPELAARHRWPPDRASIRRFAERYGGPSPKRPTAAMLLEVQMGEDLRSDVLGIFSQSEFGPLNLRSVDLVDLADLAALIYNSFEQATFEELASIFGFSTRHIRRYLIDRYSLVDRSADHP